MNSLPRFVAMALFVVLVALVSLLAVPVWQGLRADATREKAPPAASVAAGEARAPGVPNRAMILTQRGALILAGTSLGLTLLLILGQALQARAGRESPPLAANARTEVGTLARLAESTVAQGEELSRERDVRRLAEEDAQLKQKLLEQSLDERIRLGLDLHDGIIQSLYAAGLTLEAVRPMVRSNPDEAELRLEKMRESLNSAIRDVRAYIVGLAPDNLRRTGFARALGIQLGELRGDRDARLDLGIDDEAAGLLTPEQSVEILQIAREAVSNAFRHGRATEVKIRLHHSDSEIGLSIQDNGGGFDATRRRNGGHGLGNMQARARRIGASLRLTSQPGEGTRVLATLPIFKSAES